MSILVAHPKPGDVLEQGVEYTLVANCGGGGGGDGSSSSRRSFDEVHVSIADARSWSRWWRPIAECARVGADGVVSVRWRVPRDLPASDSYVVKFQSHPLRLCEAEVANVKISAPLRVSRVGRDEVQVHWSPGALPTDASARDGWRLAVDVAPVAGPGESLGDVVGDLFLQAASEGLTVHTHRRSVLYDVSAAEVAKQCKRLRLTTNRTFRIALAGKEETRLSPTRPRPAPSYASLPNATDDVVDPCFSYVTAVVVC